MTSEAPSICLQLSRFIIENESMQHHLILSNTMRRVTNKLLQKYSIKFYSMMSEIVESNISVSDVIDAMFSDDEINWGRIATVYSFARIAALHE